MTNTERLAQTQERLAKYLLAESRILQGGQDYSIGNRTLTKADLKEIRKEIEELTKECGILRRGGGGIRIQRVVLRDV